MSLTTNKGLCGAPSSPWRSGADSWNPRSIDKCSWLKIVMPQKVHETLVFVVSQT